MLTKPPSVVFHRIGREMFPMLSMKFGCFDVVVDVLLRFKEQVLIGHTQLSRAEVRAVIAQISNEFPGNSYHAMNRYAAGSCSSNSH